MKPDSKASNLVFIIALSVALHFFYQCEKMEKAHSGVQIVMEVKTEEAVRKELARIRNQFESLFALTTWPVVL
jgi:hypothetical protein